MTEQGKHGFPAPGTEYITPAGDTMIVPVVDIVSRRHQPRKSYAELEAENAQLKNELLEYRRDVIRTCDGLLKGLDELRGIK